MFDLNAHDILFLLVIQSCNLCAKLHQCPCFILVSPETLKHGIVEDKIHEFPSVEIATPLGINLAKGSVQVVQHCSQFGFEVRVEMSVCRFLSKSKQFVQTGI